jgi:hypothetical protein
VKVERQRLSSNIDVSECAVEAPGVVTTQWVDVQITLIRLVGKAWRVRGVLP